MLATPTATPGVPPSGDEWVHEVKWDGVRALAETVDGGLRIYNRNQADVTVAYPEIVAGSVGLPDGLLFDCEITALDPTTGIPTLQAIAPRIHVSNAKKAAKLMKDLGKSVTVIAMPPDGGFTVTAVDPTNFADSEPNPFDELLK